MGLSHLQMLSLQVLPPYRDLNLEDAQPPLAIAIVGRPNVGESPLDPLALHVHHGELLLWNSEIRAEPEGSSFCKFVHFCFCLLAQCNA